MALSYRFLGSSSVLQLLAFPLLLLICLATYHAGLYGPFVFDDIPTLVDNPYIRINELTISELYTAAYSTNTGPLARPVALLSFALNWFFFNDDVYYFKLTNLVLHVITAYVLFFVLRHLFNKTASSFTQNTILNASGLAFLAASIWALQPMHVSTVLYTVQRMTILATLFSLCSIYCYIKWRIEPESALRSAAYIPLSAFFLLLAIFSKENAITTLGILYFIESKFFRWHSSTNIYSLLLRVFRYLCIFTLLASIAFIAIKWTEFESTYLMRGFSWQERLLTQTRILWMYMAQVVAPNNLLFSLHHDDFGVSKSLLDPATTLISSASWLLIVFLLFKYHSRYLFLSFGLGWFVITHSLESSIIPLELVFEHRNYLPSIGVAVVLAIGVSNFGKKLSDRLAITIAFIYALILCTSTYVRAHDWQSKQRMILTDVQRHPNSYRSQYDAGLIYFEKTIESPHQTEQKKNFDKAIQHFEKSSEVNPRFIGALIAEIRLIEIYDSAVPDTELKQLIFRIQNTPITYEGARHISDWLSCNIKQQCVSAMPVLEQVTSAALRNYGLNNNDRLVLLRNAALVFANRGAFTTASDYIQKATQLSPNDPRLWAMAGKIHASAQQWSMARQAIENVRRLEPKSPDIDEILERVPPP